MSVEAHVIELIRTILKHQELPEADVRSDSPLYDDGVGMDSLAVAELSAQLEKEFGRDPYTSGILPQTVRDIVDFYDSP